MTAAEATNKEGGVIIVVTGRADGNGGEGFCHNLAHESPTLSRK
jgi:nickel-dependent lactate racemase